MAEPYPLVTERPNLVTGEYSNDAYTEGAWEPPPSAYRRRLIREGEERIEKFLNSKKEENRA